MAQQSIPLTLIPPGWFMSWELFTESAAPVCATLADSKTTYVDTQCRQDPAFGPLAAGFQQVAGSGMTLSVDLPASSRIEVATSPNVVQDADGNTVAQGYLIFVEDPSGTDVNDFYASIIAWSKTG